MKKGKIGVREREEKLKRIEGRADWVNKEKSKHNFEGNKTEIFQKYLQKFFPCKLGGIWGEKFLIYALLVFVAVILTVIYHSTFLMAFATGEWWGPGRECTFDLWTNGLFRDGGKGLTLFVLVHILPE